MILISNPPNSSQLYTKHVNVEKTTISLTNMTYVSLLSITGKGKLKHINLAYISGGSQQTLKFRITVDGRTAYETNTPFVGSVFSRGGGGDSTVSRSSNYYIANEIEFNSSILIEAYQASGATMTAHESIDYLLV